MMLKTFFSILLIIGLTSCSDKVKEDLENDIKSQPLDQTIAESPKIHIEIFSNDTLLEYGDKILLEISLTNKTVNEQNILFDKPSVLGGPWGTVGKVKEVTTKKSVLKLENKGMLSSQAFTVDELKKESYSLKPNKTITRNYELTDIVVFDSHDNKLSKGIYEVQLFYLDNPSNILTLIIQ